LQRTFVNVGIVWLMVTSDPGGEVNDIISGCLLHEPFEGRNTGLFWYLGFEHGRNKKLEEERSPEGLEEAKKGLSPPKNPLQKREKQSFWLLHILKTGQKRDNCQHTEKPIAAQSFKHPKNRCLLRFLAFWIAHSSCFLFQLFVPTVLKPQYQLSRLMARLCKYDLVVLDELGFIPFTPVGAQLLFQVCSALYERVALIITTNLRFAEWGSVMGGDERISAALLDRLTHRATILELVGTGVEY
jgi:IstB-like ATP binding protein